jgi:hypothetical protein
MHFDFRRFEELPRLAWCARLAKGKEGVQVFHGPWLETGPGFFVDGAWDGPFEERGFDRAVTFTGSGGLITPRGVLFCPATHNLERLFAIRVRSELYVSNSLVFVLTQAGEKLDLDHPDYFFDLLDHYRTGLSVRDKRLRTDSGNPVHLYDCDSMQGTVGRVMANAADGGRRRPYDALTSISRGYDSAAVSVFAARAGCEQAVTFLRSGDRTGPTTSSQWEGKLWMSGRHGEQFWHLDPVASQPWFEDPVSTSMAGANSTEVRLRLGYFHFPVPYTLGVYAPSLNRISRSAEMAAWRIGGSYDRPIPRRLLEEAGVPRALFGQTKMGGSADMPEVVTLSPRWEADFLAFYHERVDPVVRSRLVEEQIGEVPYYVKGNLGKTERWLRTRRALRRIVPRILGHRSHHRWRSRYLYTFHWGLDRLRARYSAGDT